MGFQQDVMQYAQQIQSTAIQRAYTHHEAYPATSPKGGGPGTNQPQPPYDHGGVEAYYADIPSLFQPFSVLPDPADYQAMVDTLDQALGLLRVSADVQNPIDANDQLTVAHPEIAKLTGEGDLMPNWNGTAASAFKSNFLQPFPTFTQNQFLVTAILKSAVEAHQAMWQGARADIITIARTTLDSLDNYGCGQNSWIITFTILAGIASIASAGLPEGIAMGIAAIGAAASMVTTAVPMVAKDSDKQTYSGETAAQITDAMKSAIGGLYQRIALAQGTIGDTLQTTVDGVAQNQYVYFEARRPSVADTPITQS